MSQSTAGAVKVRKPAMNPNKNAASRTGIRPASVAGAPVPFTARSYLVKNDLADLALRRITRDQEPNVLVGSARNADRNAAAGQANDRSKLPGARIEPPDISRLHFGEPELAVRSRCDLLWIAARLTDRKLRDLASPNDSQLIGGPLGEPNMLVTRKQDAPRRTRSGWNG